MFRVAQNPDAYPSSHADSFDCTDTIGHTDSVDPFNTELGHSPGHSDVFDSRASRSQAEAAARTGANIAGILAGVGVLSLLGALAMMAGQHGS